MAGKCGWACRPPFKGAGCQPARPWGTAGVLPQRALEALPLGLGPRVREPLHGALEVLPGDKVVEVRPRGVNKGRVVAQAVSVMTPGTLVAAFGDDRTDEDLFAALPEGSLSVHAGGKASRATYRVDGPAEVRKVLAALLEM